uniref:Thioredoxin-like fold domain-containing protein n=1 Tax=Amphora coffeiformis TaxID=265554 RepID=A0A7S3P5I0_9STRA|eukprot:scaffold34698_cov173-Amphora_coffeaeformis.AAC.3
MKFTSSAMSALPLLLMQSKLTKAFVVKQQHAPIQTARLLRRVVGMDAAATSVACTRRHMPSRIFSTASTNSDKKPSWEVFWDLECPFARKNWEQLPAMQQAFDSQFDFTIHLTSLAFHPGAWVGQCAAFLIRRELDTTAWLAFIDACYKQQHLYKDDLKDPRPSEVAAVFADIAQGAGLFTETFTREYFLEHVADWNEIIKPTYQEHKYALERGVFGTPKHVIDGKLVPDTESSWGVKEWRDKLETMGYLEQSA